MDGYIFHSTFYRFNHILKRALVNSPKQKLMHHQDHQFHWKLVFIWVLGSRGGLPSWSQAQLVTGPVGHRSTSSQVHFVTGHDSSNWACDKVACFRDEVGLWLTGPVTNWACDEVTWACDQLGLWPTGPVTNWACDEVTCFRSRETADPIPPCIPPFPFWYNGYLLLLQMDICYVCITGFIASQWDNMHSTLLSTFIQTLGFCAYVCVTARWERWPQLFLKQPRYTNMHNHFASGHQQENQTNKTWWVCFARQSTIIWGVPCHFHPGYTSSSISRVKIVCTIKLCPGTGLVSKDSLHGPGFKPPSPRDNWTGWLGAKYE